MFFWFRWLAPTPPPRIYLLHRKRRPERGKLADVGGRGGGGMKQFSNQCCGSGSGMGKNSGSGSGMNNPDHISESLGTIFWKILKFIDPEPGSGIFLTLDPGSGMEKIRIRDKHPGSGKNIPDPGKTSRIRNTVSNGRAGYSSSGPSHLRSMWWTMPSWNPSECRKAETERGTRPVDPSSPRVYPPFFF